MSAPENPSAAGLSGAEAARLLVEHGANEVAPAAEHPGLALLGKFWGLSAWMLELILALSLALRHYTDAAVIGALLCVNAAVAFLLERRAAGAVQALRRRLQAAARVLRDAAWKAAPSRELVPGDVVRVRSGDIVPADLRLLEGALSLDQSVLTGESMDAAKAAGDGLPSGSVVRRGEGTCVVLLTGAETLYGRTTRLVQEAHPEFHAHAVMTRVMGWLFLVVGSLLALVLGLSILRHAPLLGILPLMLILLMSAVPVTLPVMFTVSMALGSRELAKKGVLVTRLSAAEDAATMDTLCVDKTGTITANRLAVTQVLPRAPATEADLLAAAALASQVADQDPLDLALCEAARVRRAFDGRPAAKPLQFTPFDASRRRTEAVVEVEGRRLRVMKGAVETIAQACGLAPSDTAALAAEASAAALMGHRTVAVAQGPESGAPVLLGLVALFDPPRPDAAGLIASLRGLGVAVKLLTGDALAVAAETAAGLGLPKIRRMADVKAAPDQDALAMLLEADGFAEVYPEDKFLSVKRLQAGGHVTGMTGDGVNDAPALRQAEVGIAVSSATDVAKAAASVVLTEPGLANIVALVTQGRTIYQRILTYIVNKISRTVLKTAFVAIAFVVTGKFVLSAFAMLVLVFITDFAKISLATDRVRPSRRPETWNIGPLIAVSGALGALMAVEALLLLWGCWVRFGLAEDPAALCSTSFLILLYFAAFSILSARERGWFWSSLPSRPVLGAVAAELCAGTALTFAGLPGLRPLAWPLVAMLFASAMAACLLINDPLKVALIRMTGLDQAGSARESDI